MAAHVEKHCESAALSQLVPSPLTPNQRRLAGPSKIRKNLPTVIPVALNTMPALAVAVLEAR
jgi:hypothetical protein